MKLQGNLLPPLPKRHCQCSSIKNNDNKPMKKRPLSSVNFNTINNTKPTLKLNQNYYDKHSRNWFKHKYHQTQIVNSINSLIPPAHDSYSHNAMTRSHSYHTKRIESLPISLKYIFPPSTYAQIIKLRELFIDFDKDTNQRMELGEIETMFNVNQIKVSKADLLSLFFQKTFDDSIINEDKKMFLSFDQFITFCLGRDQEFRVFMRELKSKKDMTHDNEFLPMNFNTLLDYFISKGDERKAKKKIETAIDTMKNVLELRQYKISDNNDNNQSDGIDFYSIMNEFEKLFLLTQSRIDVSKKKRARSAKQLEKKTLKKIPHSKPILKNCKTLFGSIPKVNMQTNNTPIMRTMQISKTYKYSMKEESFQLSSSSSNHTHEV